MFDIKIAQTPSGPRFVTVLPPAAPRHGEHFDLYQFAHSPRWLPPTEPSGIYDQIQTKADQAE